MSVQFSQPSTSRRHLRDEEQPFEHHTQPRLDPDPQQAPLASLRSLYPSARALVIVLKSEALLIDGHQMVFEGSFENNNEVQTVIRFSHDIGHCLYLKVRLITWVVNGRQVTSLQCFARFYNFCMFKLLS